MAEKPSDVRFWVYIFIGFGVFNLVAGALWVMRTFEEDRIARTRSAVSTVNPAVGDGDLRIDAWTNTSRVAAGHDMLAFSIGIQNPSTQTAVRDVRFTSFDLADGFGVPLRGEDAICWSKEAQPKPVCVTSDNLTTRPVRWPITIAPGGGTTVATRLKVVDEPGRWYLTAVFAWVDVTHQTSRRKGVSLGPIIVENQAEKNKLLWAKAAQTYLKDLVWPQLAALFGIWVKRLDDKRAQQRENEKEVTERSMRLAQENRAMVQQTWTLMLPTSHRINTMYYMPISHAAGQIYHLHRKIGASPFAADECFYFLWHLHKMVADFIRKEGGWYLKNRRGEEIVAATWRVVRAWTDDFIAENTSDRAARFIREEAVSRFPEEQTTFAYFTAHLARRAPFPDLRTWFDDALTHATAAIVMAVFELMEHVIDFEINRPYIYWYGGEDQMVKFDLAAFNTITAKIRQSRNSVPGTPYDESLDLLDAEIKAYHGEITKPTTA